jgi:hypothetical protein
MILWKNRQNRAMKYSLPILTSGLLCTLAVGAALWERSGGIALFAQRVVDNVQSTAAPRSDVSRADRGTPTDGQALVAAAARAMHESPPLDARLVVQINLLDQSMSGPGTYFHLGHATDMSRLEMKVGVEGSVTSFQQVCDGRYLWVRRHAGEEKSLVRVDLRRIDRAREVAAVEGSVRATPRYFGGLPQLLDSLDRCFQFDEPRADQLDEIPVWVLRGTWKPDRLAAMTRPSESGGKDSSGNVVSEDRGESETASDDATSLLASLPRHVPHEVVLTLGRDDTFPLFPYCVEFRSTVAGKLTDGGAGEARSTESIVRIEFFSVRRRDDFDQLHFRYEAGDQEIDDRTAPWLERLGLPVPPR